MAREFSMPYMIPPVGLLPPAADAGGRTSAYHTLKNALKAYVIAEVNQGNAATVLLTLLQAKDVSGTGSKALTGVVPIWLENNTATSDALVSQAAAVNFTTDATTNNKIVVFEITPEQCMDLANGFRSIAISTGASNAANITRADLYIYGSIQSATPPTSVI